MLHRFFLLPLNVDLVIRTVRFDVQGLQQAALLSFLILDDGSHVVDVARLLPIIDVLLVGD